MDQFTRKGNTPPKVIPVVPVNPDAEEEDCGCGESGSSQSSSGSGACPTEAYVTGGFSLVVKNNTSGRCQILNLDYIQDSQDPYTPPKGGDGGGGGGGGSP